MTFSYLQELVSWIWWLSVVSTLFYVVFFAVGPGSIPWMITAELFSQGPRPAAMSVAVLINWCANFMVAIGFPTMQVGQFLPWIILNDFIQHYFEVCIMSTFPLKPSNLCFSELLSNPFDIPDYVGELYISAVQCVSCDILGLYLQKSSGNEKQNIWRNRNSLQNTK